MIFTVLIFIIPILFFRGLMWKEAIIAWICVLPLIESLVDFKLFIETGYSLKNLALIILLITAFINKSKFQWPPIGIINNWIYFISSIILCSLINFMYYPNYFISTQEYVFFIKTVSELIIVLLSISWMSIDEEGIIRIFTKLFIVIGILIIMNFLAMLFGLDVKAASIIKGRLSGIFGEPNYTSLYLSFLLPIGLMNLAYEKNGFKKILFWGTLLFLYLLEILYTASKGGILSLIVAFLAFYLFQAKLSDVNKIYSFIIVFFIIILTYIILPSDLIYTILDRIAFGNQYNINYDMFLSGRNITWERIIHILFDSPVIGMGYQGFFSWHFVTYGYPSVAHITYLAPFIDYGFFTGTLFLILFFKIAYYASYKNERRGLYIASFLALAVGMLSLELSNYLYPAILSYSCYLGSRKTIAYDD